jgi:hypothetical protein
MASSGRGEAIGTVTLVQEGRFRLTADDDWSQLFVLGHGAALEAQDLKPLAEAGTRVRVRYRETEYRTGLIVLAMYHASEPSEQGAG